MGSGDEVAGEQAGWSSKTGKIERMAETVAAPDTSREVDPARIVTEGTLDRVATVDEVARLVELFVGPLGAFVSGQVLRVDGAAQCWPG
jgi:NAD(P)-dependent dehydrogenase (short-subunit alcohol dehydrogenase family)